MKKEEQMAFPSFATYETLRGTNTEYNTGLTKREYFAGLAMQGLMTKAYYTQTDNENVDEIAKLIAEASIIIADELLKQLEDGKTERN